jgi:hypothetical protein
MTLVKCLQVEPVAFGRLRFPAARLDGDPQWVGNDFDDPLWVVASSETMR